MQGILLSIVMAFIVLVFSTGNLRISFIAIWCISSIILSLLSMIALLEWKFGMIESTCVIVFIGISVDYVVHICHNYTHALELSPKARMDHAYRQIGKAIVGGALTSCFSAGFLIVCQASSLNKFGVLLLTTILCSMLTALIMLPSILYVVGP